VPAGQPFGGRHGVVALALVGAAVGEFQQIAETLLFALGEWLGNRSFLGFSPNPQNTPADPVG
jgi:hypothetical protein